MARSEVGDEQALWYGRVVRLVKLTGQVEEADLLWRVIAPDVGACTRAYLCKDLEGWNRHLTRIRVHLDMHKGPMQCHPTWC